MNKQEQSLGSFYASKCGRSIQKQLSHFIRMYWPEVEGHRLLTAGYATPFCAELEKHEPQVIIEIDPTGRSEQENVLNISESSFPFPNESFQHVLVVNSLEYIIRPKSFLREIWRILSPNGSLVCIVPNRHSLWGVQKKMPPMQGNLYTAKELTTLLAENMFLPKRQDSAGFLPPSAYLHRVEILDEFISHLPFAAGAFIISEAEKQPLRLEKSDQKRYKSARMTKASALSSPRS